MQNKKDKEKNPGILKTVRQVNEKEQRKREERLKKQKIREEKKT